MYAENIAELQKNLVRVMVFLSRKFLGRQQVRLRIGHKPFGGSIQYGVPLFLDYIAECKTLWSLHTAQQILQR